MKLPAIQFYPADWRTDIGVQSLSFHDRGIWFEMLCVMHESEQRGKLIHNGKPMSEESIARLIGCDIKSFRKALKNIIDSGVCSKDGDIIFNRRMVKDDELIQKRRACGSLGGNPKLKQNQKEVGNLDNQNPNQNLTPSSSFTSSSSITDNIHTPEPQIFDLDYFKGIGYMFLISDELKNGINNFLMYRNNHPEHGPIKSAEQIEGIIKGFSTRQISDSDAIKMIQLTIEKGAKNIIYEIKKQSVKGSEPQSKLESIIESNRKVHQMIDEKYGTGKD